MYVRYTHRMYTGKYQWICPGKLSGKLPICNVLRHIGTYLHKQTKTAEGLERISIYNNTLRIQYISTFF